MPENHEKLLADLQAIQSLSQGRNVALGKVADLLRGYGGYRWVGLYDVDHAAGIVKNVVWSGSGRHSGVSYFSNYQSDSRI